MQKNFTWTAETKRTDISAEWNLQNIGAGSNRRHDTTIWQEVKTCFPAVRYNKTLHKNGRVEFNISLLFSLRSWK